MYIACGQDAACVAEGQVGITRFELTEKVPIERKFRFLIGFVKGDLYCSTTLPGILVGIVGGGTNLPSQR